MKAAVFNVQWVPDIWNKLGRVSYKFNSMMFKYEVMFYTDAKHSKYLGFKYYDTFEEMKAAIEAYNS